MKWIIKACLLSLVFLIQPVFALDDDSDDKPCATVVKSCLDAGYTRSNNEPNKKFWQDCMKPLLLGKTVEGVTLDPAVAKDCRVNKIEKMKQEIKELQEARN